MCGTPQVLHTWLFWVESRLQSRIHRAQHPLTGQHVASNSGRRKPLGWGSSCPLPPPTPFPSALNFLPVPALQEDGREASPGSGIIPRLTAPRARAASARDCSRRPPSGSCLHVPSTQQGFLDKFTDEQMSYGERPPDKLSSLFEG